MKKEEVCKEFKVYGDGTKGIKNTLSLLHLFKPYKWSIFFFILLNVISAALNILIPIINARYIAYLNNSEIVKFIIAVAILLGCNLASRMLSMLSAVLITNPLINKVSYNFKMMMFRDCFRLKMQNFDNAHSGFFLSTMNSSTNTFFDMVLDNIKRIMDIFTRIFFISYSFSLNLWCGIYLIVAFVISFVIQYYRIKSWTKRSKVLNDKRDVTSSLMNESLRGLRDIKYSKLEDEIYDKNAELQKEYIKLKLRKENISDVTSHLAYIVDQLLVFGFMGIVALMMHLEGLLPVVALTLINFYSRSMYLISSIQTLMKNTKNGELHAYRINKILSGYDFGFESFGTEDAPTGKKDVLFKNVSFGYKDEKILKNLSFKIKENSVVGICGESGVGKSTMIKLLAGMYDASEGEISIAGVNIKNLSKNALRSLMTIVPQDPYIFNMTFRENLKLVCPDATDEQIIDAFKKAQLYDFILSQKDGLDTKLGENGLILSGGQKQRVALARALINNTPILILDEATSSLDNENQEKIKKVISSLSGKRTVIIIAHRLSTIIDADDILFIKDGKVFKRGTHKKLIESCEEYKKLYKSENNNKKATN